MPLNGSDNPSSRYQPFRFCLSAIPTCRYLPLLDIACHALQGYPLKAGQLTYDCRYSTMHGMPVTGGRGFRGLKPLWYNSVPP